MKKYLILIFLLCLSIIYSLNTPIKSTNIISNKKTCPAWFLKDVSSSPFKSLYGKLFLACNVKGRSLQVFYNSGLGHLLTISGLHIASLVFLIYFLLNIIFRLFFASHIPLFYFTLPSSLVFTLLYVLFIGAEVPRLRALVMLSFLSLSFIFHFFKDRLFVIFLSMILILFLFPNSIYSGSFYFSYIAVLSIYLANGVKKYKNIYVTSLIFVFLIPLNLYFRGEINFLYILGNILFIPVFSLFYYPYLLFSSIFAFLFRSTLLMDIATYIFYNMVKLFAILSSKTNMFVMYLDLYGVIFLYIISITSFMFFETYKMRFFILLLMSFVLLSQASLLRTYFIKI